jgi:high-affinity nickel permease
VVSTLALYLRGASFKPWLGDQITVVFLRPSRQLSGFFLKIGHSSIFLNPFQFIIYYLTFFKNESEALEITILHARLPVCLYLSLIIVNHLLIVYEIQQGGHAAKGYLDAIISNHVALTIPKLRSFTLLRRTQNLHQSS